MFRRYKPFTEEMLSGLTLRGRKRGRVLNECKSERRRYERVVRRGRLDQAECFQRTEKARDARAEMVEPVLRSTKHLQVFALQGPGYKLTPRSGVLHRMLGGFRQTVKTLS